MPGENGVGLFPTYLRKASCVLLTFLFYRVRVRPIPN